jgi:hypothetical protein
MDPADLFVSQLGITIGRSDNFCPCPSSLFVFTHCASRTEVREPRCANRSKGLRQKQARTLERPQADEPSPLALLILVNRPGNTSLRPRLAFLFVLLLALY